MNKCCCSSSNQGEMKDILEFAITKEQEAADFYYEIASKVKNKGIKDELVKIAKMEEGHRDKLKKLEIPKMLDTVIKNVTDLKISNYMVETKPQPDMNWQDILNIAMKRELASANMYNELANKSTNDDLKKMFKALAQEENKHKLYFETIYDEEILTWN
jgi:rubrerythrin